MKVKAIKPIYYGNQLKPVDSIFELVPYKGPKPKYDKDGKPVLKNGKPEVEEDHLFSAEEQFSEEGMEKVDGDQKVGVMKDRISETPLKDEKEGKPLPNQHGRIATKSDKDVI